MKNPVLLFAGMVLTLLATTILGRAQETEKKSNFTTGADLYSNYIWRGTRFGQGPSVQPTVKFTTGRLTLGVWGAFDFHNYSEADPYISISLPIGFNFGLTDYYYPGLPVFEISKAKGCHALEINMGYTIKGMSLSANYILNEADQAGCKGNDIYIQAGYTFTSFNIFAGAGNGWYTVDNKFNLCNVGVGTSKVIKVSDSFSIPVVGQIILNPDKQQMYIVAGFSF
jgi:hypothetical protein